MVDLEAVEGQVCEPGEGRMPGAEIIEHKARADRFQRHRGSQCLRLVAQRRLLGQLDPDRALR